MRYPRYILRQLAMFASLVLTFIVLVSLCGLVYTISLLWQASTKGVYVSAEDGMLALLDRGYVQPDEIEIAYAGTNSFDGSEPHVWYVIACIWGGTRADGTPPGSERHDYDQPGSFFLNTKQGWVHVSESAYPRMLGFWMKVFGQAGPGSSIPTHDFGSNPQGKCEF
jgi:hypothetical protein